MATDVRLPVPLPRDAEGNRTGLRPDRDYLLRQYLSTASGLLLGGAVFFVTLLDYGTDLGRTALAGKIFSGFFDDQARALLDGNLALPEGSLGIEGFVHDGKTYMYFPPWPSVLRLPVLMTTHEYDARLTVLSMALCWVLFAVVVVKLAWLLVGQLGFADRLPRRVAVLVALFVACATGGTFLTYDAGQPWVYHEVYMWAVTAALGGMYWLARVWLSPSTHSAWWLFVFAMVAVGSRATEGWALSLVAMLAGLLLLRSADPARRRLWWRVLLAGAVPLAVSITINMIKFDAIYLFPLQEQVWTQVNEQRRIALERNGGTLTGPQFFTTSVMAYLRPDGIRFVDYFPWITLPAHAATAYHGAYPDQVYRTGSAPSFMPLFALMLVVSTAAILRRRASRVLVAMRLPLLAGVLLTGGVMGYGYYATRYTSEFVPAFVLGGAIGTALLARAVDRHRRWTGPAVAAVGALTVFSLAAQMAIGTTAAAFVHRGAPLLRYVEWQHRWSPDEQASLVSRIDGLPSGGQTDDLAIRGDCEALYINTGDKYEPWLPVFERDRVLVFTPTESLKPGIVDVATVEGRQTGSVQVQVSAQQQVRFIVDNGEDRVTGPWLDPPTTGGVRLGIRNRIDIGYYEFDSAPGTVTGYIPSVYFDESWDSLPALLTTTADPGALADLGLSFEERAGLPQQICADLEQRLDEQGDR
jgi:hypothetical protein